MLALVMSRGQNGFVMPWAKEIDILLFGTQMHFDRLRIPFSLNTRQRRIGTPAENRYELFVCWIAFSQKFSDYEQEMFSRNQRTPG